MNTLTILIYLLLGGMPLVNSTKITTTKIVSPSPIAQKLSILYPKPNQKVRGQYKIYGKATPGSIVKLQVSSTYFKTAHNNQERISKGEGPIKRMNRKFSITTDRSGTWTLKNIELLNAGWEGTFTITASAVGQQTVTVTVFDKVHPINID